MRYDKFTKTKYLKQPEKIGSVVSSLLTKLGANNVSRPIQTFKNKGIDVAIWETAKGAHTVTIRKTYKCKQTNTWKETKNLYKEEVDSLIALLQEASGWLSGRAPVVAQPVVEKEIDFDDLPF